MIHTSQMLLLTFQTHQAKNLQEYERLGRTTLNKTDSSTISPIRPCYSVQREASLGQSFSYVAICLDLACERQYETLLGTSQEPPLTSIAQYPISKFSKSPKFKTRYLKTASIEAAFARRTAHTSISWSLIASCAQSQGP